MNKLSKVLISLGAFIFIATIAIGLSVGIGVLFKLGLNNTEINVVNAAENNNFNNLTIIENMPFSGIYDFKDPETGIHYIIVAKSSGVAITPRLDKDGNIMKD